MLRGFVLPNENYRNIPAVAFLQNGILIHVHFAKHRGKVAQYRRDRGLRFVAKMATWARVQRNVLQPAPRQSQIFRGIAHGWGFEYFMMAGCMSLAEAGCIGHLPGRSSSYSENASRKPRKN